MRGRPEITIHLPTSVRAGETLRVDVTLLCRSETPIDFVRVVLRCAEVLRATAEAQVLLSRDWLSRSKQVAGKGRLHAGSHQYDASFAIPESAPPTYAGAAADYSWRIEVRVAIPWWLDARESSEVTVKRAPLRARTADAPVSGSSLSGNAPFVEVALPGTQFTPGDTIQAAVAFGHLGGRRVDGIDAGLVTLERVHVLESRFTAEAYRTSNFRDGQRMREGVEVPFRIAVPSGTPLGFETKAVTVAHAIEVRLEVGGDTLIHRMPVEIGAFPRRLGQDERASVGANRWRAEWERAGRGLGLVVDPGKLELAGLIAGCSVRVRPRLGDGAPPGLEAIVAFPSPWGLALSVGRRRLRDLDLGAALGDDPFARHYRARGRDEAQVQAALSPELRAALLAFDAEVSDEGARLWSDATPYDEASVRAFADSAAALADAAYAATAALPPPPAMAEVVPAWSRLAANLGGALAVGDMRLRGASFEGAAVSLATTFEGAEPAGAALAVAIDPPLARGFNPARDDRLAAAPASVRALCATIQAQAAELAPAAVTRPPSLRVHRARVALTMGAPLGEAADARRVRELLGAMVALGEALRGERRAGPYR